MKRIKAKLIIYDLENPETLVKVLELKGGISVGEEKKSDKVLWFAPDELEIQEVLNPKFGNQLQIEIHVGDVLKELLKVADLPINLDIMKESREVQQEENELESK